MQTIKLTLIAALVGVASSAAFAQDANSDQSRRDRMDAAYSDYRASHPGATTSGSGTSRASTNRDGTLKGDMHRTGRSIKRGAEKVGHAIGTGVRKTGEAIGHGGEKMQDASTPKQ